MKLRFLLALLLLTSIFAESFKGKRFSSDSLTLITIKRSNPNSYIKWSENQPIETWKGLTWKDIDGERRVVCLRLQLKNLRQIPVEIGKLDQLKELIIYGNSKLTDLPHEVGALPNLKTLSIGKNHKMRNLPPGFPALTHLYASNTRSLSFTPNSDGSWGYQNLEVVNLFRAYSPKRHHILAKLPRLYVLNISHPSTNWPPKINPQPGEFPALDSLIISYATSKSLSKISFHFPSLSYLELSFGKYSAVPYDKIAAAQKLTTLNIRGTQLQTIPKEIELISSLEKLDARSCSLTTISPHIATLQNLRILNVHNNRLSSIPIEIASMDSLNALIISKNRFETIQSDFAPKFQTKMQRSGLYNNPWLYKKSPSFVRRLEVHEKRSAKDNRYTIFPITQYGGYPLAYSIEFSFTRTDDYQKSLIFSDHGYGGLGFDLSIEPGVHGIRANTGILFLPFDNGNSWGYKQFMLRGTVMHLWSGDNKDKTFAGVELGVQFVGTLRFGIAKELKGKDIMFTICGGIPAPATLFILGGLAH